MHRPSAGDPVPELRALGKCSVPRPGSPVPNTPERRQGLRACASNARGTGSIPGQGTQIPHAPQGGQKEKIQVSQYAFRRILCFEAYVISAITSKRIVEQHGNWRTDFSSTLGYVLSQPVASVGWCTLKNEGPSVRV